MRHRASSAFWRALLAAAAIGAAAAPGRAQEILWSRTYGDADAETAWAADNTADGGFVLFGYEDTASGDDFLLIKTDSEGNEEWSRTWGGGSTDWGFSVRQLPDQGFVVAGMFGTGSQIHDAYLARTDPQGNLQWSRQYGLPAVDERAHSVWPTSDGGFAFAGQQRVGTFPFDSYDVWLVKTDASGNMEWDALYARESFGNDIGLAVEETTGGGYIIGGLTQSSDWACYLLRTDAIGNHVWAN
ncbi:MAG: hypothetical protein OEP45_15965, partial [Acidobacteriota bacterium]|nr:hypothetical protein [Acidobacteriota bacterium]